jgi:hypothetical protein
VRVRPEGGRSRIGLRGLVLWLAAGTLLWYRLIGWPPPALPLLPSTLPSWAMVDVWLRSPLAADWTGFVAAIGLIGWVFWAWAWVTVLLEVGVNLVDAATHHAAWVAVIRGELRPLTVPFIRRIVDASLGGLLLARVALQPAEADAAVPWRAEGATVAPSDTRRAELHSATGSRRSPDRSSAAPRTAAPIECSARLSVSCPSGVVPLYRGLDALPWEATPPDFSRTPGTRSRLTNWTLWVLDPLAA